MRKAALCFLVVVGMSADHALAECKLNRVGQLQAQVERNQITIPGAINGKPVRFLFDVASPGTMVTAPAAQRLGLNVVDLNISNTGMTSHNYATIGYAMTDEVQFDRFVAKGLRVTVRSQLQDYGAPELVGILGNDLLGQYDIEIDLEKHLITLYKPQDCGTTPLAFWGNPYSMLELKPDNRVPQFTARINDQDVVAVLDTGSPFSAVSDQAAGKVGMAFSGADVESVETAGASDYFTLTYDPVNGFAPTPRGANMTMGGEVSDPGGAKHSWLVRVDSVQLDQELVRPAKLRVLRFVHPAETGQRLPTRSSFHEDMLLGVDFLQSHHVMISRSQNRLYFSYAGGPAFQGMGQGTGTQN